MKDFDLPNGVTLEMLDAYARKKENARRRADYAAHPERVHRNRVQSSINFLKRSGYTVINGDIPPLPWGKAEKQAILQQLEAARRDEGGTAQ